VSICSVYDREWEKVGLCKRKFAEVVSLRSCVCVFSFRVFQFGLFHFILPRFWSRRRVDKRKTKPNNQAQNTSGREQDQYVQRARFLCATLAVAEADLHKLPPNMIEAGLRVSPFLATDG
jgi:hypothetical protein